MDDAPYVLALYSRFNEIRLLSVDNLEALHQTCVSDKVEENLVEWKRLQFPPLQFLGADRFDEGSGGIHIGIGVEESINIFDQNDRLAAETLSEDIAPSIGSVGWDASN